MTTIDAIYRYIISQFYELNYFEQLVYNKFYPLQAF